MPFTARKAEAKMVKAAREAKAAKAARAERATVVRKKAGTWVTRFSRHATFAAEGTARQNAGKTRRDPNPKSQAT